VSAFEDAKARWAKIADLAAALSVLHWDQATYLPRRAFAARGRQLAALTETLHAHRTDPALGQLMERCGRELHGVDSESDEARMLCVAQRDFERARRVPAEFAARLAAHQSVGYVGWARAREADDFASIVPVLERTLEFSREYASFHPGFSHVADPLIDHADPGMTVARIEPLFAELRAFLVPLLRRIAERPKPDRSMLQDAFDAGAQIAFARRIVESMGYDFERGRMDLTPHPFMVRLAGDDVRITTRIGEDDLSDSLFSAIHEAGHALYELGIAPHFDRSPLGAGVSAGVHESQSRLWENLVCRSRPFWEHHLPQLQRSFPQLRRVDAESFYRAINCVEPSLIRTESDEVTYNLHVIIRFELELQMLTGELAVRDLAEAWNERYRSDLGIEPKGDSDGVLQDVHWYSDLIGGQFQCYALGNILSAQLFAAANAARSEIAEELAAGQFGSLRGWLLDNVHRYGRKLEADTLIERATGAPLRLDAYRAYLQRKFCDLYALDVGSPASTDATSVARTDLGSAFQ